MDVSPPSLPWFQELGIRLFQEWARSLPVHCRTIPFSSAMPNRLCLLLFCLPNTTLALCTWIKTVVCGPYHTIPLRLILQLLEPSLLLRHCCSIFWLDNPSEHLLMDQGKPLVSFSLHGVAIFSEPLLAASYPFPLSQDPDKWNDPWWWHPPVFVVAIV